MKDFNYKKYISEQYTYEPLQWPSDIRLGALHNACSHPGIPISSDIKCKCCGINLKNLENWVKADFSEDMRHKHPSIYCYLEMQKIFMILSIILVLLGSGFQLYQTFIHCRNNALAQPCYTWYFMYFADYATLISSSTSAELVIPILSLCMLGCFLIANIRIISILCAVHSEANSRKVEHSIMVEGTSIQEVNNHINSCGVNQHIVIKLAPIQKEFTLREKAKRLYYKIKADYAFERNLQAKQREQTELRQTLRQIKSEQLQPVSDHNVNVIIIFKNQSDAIKIKQHWGSKADLLNNPDEVRWEKSGTVVTRKKLITSMLILATILGVFNYVFQVLMAKKFLLSLQKNLTNTLSTQQQFYNGLISTTFPIYGFIYSAIVRKSLDHISNKTFYNRLILMFNNSFSLTFFLLTPISNFIYTSTNNIVTSTTGLITYTIISQALNVITIQLGVSIKDFRYAGWDSQRKAIMTDPYEAMLYNQAEIQKKNTIPEYPIEYKMVTFLRIYGFIAVFTIMSPYIPIILLIASIVIFLLQKRNLYTFYRLRQTDVHFMILGVAVFTLTCEVIFAVYYIKIMNYFYSVNSLILTIVCLSLLGVAQITKLIIYKMFSNRGRSQDDKEQSLDDSTERSKYMEVGDYQKKYNEFIKDMRDVELFEQINSKSNKN